MPKNRDELEAEARAAASADIAEGLAYLARSTGANREAALIRVAEAVGRWARAKLCNYGEEMLRVRATALTLQTEEDRKPRVFPPELRQASPADKLDYIERHPDTRWGKAKIDRLIAAVGAQQSATPPDVEPRARGTLSSEELGRVIGDGATILPLEDAPDPKMLEVKAVDGARLSIVIGAVSVDEAMRALKQENGPLKRNKEGRPYASKLNVRTVLTILPMFAESFRMNELTNEIEVTKEKPWHALTPPAPCASGLWIPEDNTRLEMFIDRWLDFRPSEQQVIAVVTELAQLQSYHPVRVRLRSLEWDGARRIDSWLPAYLGAADTNYTRLVGRLWLIAAVARVMQPGCKCDYSLILQGKQGVGKSSVFAILALNTEWHTESVFDLANKDAVLQVERAWIVDFSELDVLRRVEMNRAKSFLTARFDSIRRPYAKTVVRIPRQCIFGGTTNSDTFVRDETGGRRFWPVPIHSVNFEALERDAPQLWAEAVCAFDEGAKWHPTREEEARFILPAQQSIQVTDEWDEPVTAYLDRIGPSADVTTTEIVEEVLRLSPATTPVGTHKRIAGIFRQDGRERVKGRRGGRVVWVFRVPRDVPRSPESFPGSDEEGTA
jgi:predicted P-loop ATPase